MHACIVGVCRKLYIVHYCTWWPEESKAFAAVSAMALLNELPIGFAHTINTFFCTPGRPEDKRVITPV